ncbi:MAG TPA: threonine synthase, partial [Candidatus Dormibacteraeota bacterium]|nr:threonine synthase [Candidatus Dormibacteraeota bacterium]
MSSSFLRCADPGCSTESESVEISYACASCGGLQEVGYRFDAADPSRWRSLWRERHGSNLEVDRSGVWRYRELLPFLADEVPHISLGEGSTPLVSAPQAATWAGLERLEVKHLGVNPTGSFKDLGMTACI